MATPADLKRHALHSIQAGKPADAVRSLRPVLAVEPADAGAWQMIAVAGQGAGARDAGLGPLRRAMQLAPADPRLRATAAGALAALGNVGAAIEVCRSALALAPGEGAIHRLLSAQARAAGKGSLALAAARHAVRLDPAEADSWVMLGNAFGQMGRPDDAAGAFRRAHARAPGVSPFLANLATVLNRAGRPAGALTAARGAACLDPGFAWACNDAALALQGLGDAEAGLRWLARGVVLAPGERALHANLVSATHMVGSKHGRPLLERARAWSARFAEPLGQPARRDVDAAIHDPRPDRRLRVGYVAADTFREHTHATLLLPLLEAHDPAAIEVICYSDTPATRADRITARFRAAAAIWRDVRGLGDAAVARLVRDDRVDVLVDYFGFADGSRLGVAAHRPAPVQVNLVLMGSSGMTALDYVVADRHLIPVEDEPHYAEAPVRLPSGYLFDPLVEAPAVTPRPDGPIVFGSFNVLPKNSPAALEAWARLLERLPDARLMVKARVLGDGPSRAAVAARMVAAGLPADRVDLIGWTPDRTGHLGMYDRVDVLLDSFPYNGANITRDALWMGVPVVTLAGGGMVGRYGASILQAAGFGAWVATDMAGYVEIAVELARDAARRASLRANLRELVRGSALCDRGRYARALERAYREMWRRQCAGLPRAPIDVSTVA